MDIEVFHTQDLLAFQKRAFTLDSRFLTWFAYTSVSLEITSVQSPIFEPTLNMLFFLFYPFDKIPSLDDEQECIAYIANVRFKDTFDTENVSMCVCGGGMTNIQI